MKHAFYAIGLLVLLLFSCKDASEDSLRRSLSRISSEKVCDTDKKEESKVSLSQYEDYEFKLNERYISDLKSLIDNAFSTQLENFEENELGVISGYKYMFKYATSSKTEWDDLQLQLSDRYFNTLQIKQDVYKLALNHNKEIQKLRSRFSEEKNGNPLPQTYQLDLPQSEVYVGGLDSHSRNNLAVEIGTTVLDVLMGLLITWIVINILGYACTGPIGCVVSTIVTIIIILISILCTNYNDGKLLDSLKQQEKNQVVNYDVIKQELNNNTRTFYENCK